MATRIHKVDAVGSRTAFGASSFFLGIPFLAVGIYFALAGFGFCPLAGQAHVPLWVIGFVGCAFAMAGAFVTYYGLSGLWNRRRAKTTEPWRTDEPWFVDYPWQPDGIRDRAAARPMSALIGTIFLAVFFVPLNWFALFAEDTPLLLRLFAGAADLLFLAALLATLYRFGQLFKFGYGFLKFKRFPFRTGEQLEVTFSPNRFEKLRATLRFIEERIEVRGSGRNRSKQLVPYALYTQEQMTTPHRLDPEVNLAFDLPDKPEWSNAISGKPVRYWELLLRADIPGIDFRTTFLLPVYAKKDDARASSQNSSSRESTAEDVRTKLSSTISP